LQSESLLDRDRAALQRLCFLLEHLWIRCLDPGIIGFDKYIDPLV
jgi:hypothetical protein